MSDSTPLPFDMDALCEIFRSAERPKADFKIGIEAEKFGLSAAGRPLLYQGARGVEGLFEGLIARGWSAERETTDGPLIALSKGGASVTLEPAAQVELSGSPNPSVHDVVEELQGHLQELAEVTRGWDLYWLHLGFHPLARHGDLPWVPKQRYPVMQRYLPTKGARGLDMMTRTATVQVNLDYENERDAMDKLVTLLKLTPFLQAMTLNAPFFEGAPSTLKSERLDVWLNMDPARSGLVGQLWDLPSPSYRDYAAWALQAGMFLFKRGTTPHLNTGQTFEDFLKNGFNGERATFADWKLHLGTLFPEVRLKTTLEVRGIDAQPTHLVGALPALLVGLLYDTAAFAQARELVSGVSHEQAVQLQRRIAVDGLAAQFRDAPVQRIALQLLDLAAEGLGRRGQERSELAFLAPLRALTERGLTPGDVALAQYRQSGKALPEFLCEFAADLRTAS